MTGKQRIEKLTDTWYGYTLFANLVTLVFVNGIGFFSVPFALVSTAFGLFVTFLVGRWLLARSSIGRLVVLCLSGLGLLVGALATFRFGGAFLAGFRLEDLAQTVVIAAGVLVNLRSIRTLTDASVKAYIRG